MIALKLNTAPARRALRPDPRVRARAVPRARRARPKGFAWIAFAIGLCGVFGLSYVSETAAATQASYQIANLRVAQQRLVGEQQQIRYQISLASSAGRLDADAGRLGLVRSGQWQYLAGSTSPVALAHPDSGTSDRQARSWLDQLAIALGQPTEAQAKGR